MGDLVARQTAGVDALWANGISGDLPIVLVALDDASHVDMVREVLRAQAYWRSKCLAVDLVLVNEALRFGATRYEVTVENPEGVCRGVARLELDGVATSDHTGIPVVDDHGVHRVRAVLGVNSR